MYVYQMGHELNFHKLNKKQKQMCIDWVSKHGCACLDFKNRDVILHDGGLFSIDKDIVKMHKLTGKFKKLPDDCYQMLFTKKKYPHETYDATLWFEDVDDTIRWFKSLKRLLNSLGYKTQIKKRIKSS